MSNKNTIIPFGKFKGKTLGDADRDYLEWMATVANDNDFGKALKVFLAEPQSNYNPDDPDIGLGNPPF